MTESTRQLPTKKQHQLLSFVGNFISEHGYSPSYREIKNGLGYGSVATVAQHVDNLIKRGQLAKGKNRARSLEVVGNSTNHSNNVITNEQSIDGKWLIKAIDSRFKQVEKLSKPSKKQVDNLYVLTGALKVLGFEDAARGFVARLGRMGRNGRR